MSESRSNQGLVLVVGATGNLGSETTRLLLSEGYRVRAMTRDTRKAEALAKLGAEIFQADLTNSGSLREACQGVRYVIASAHAAMEKGPNNPVTVDGKGHRDLIDAALAAGVLHFGYASVSGIGPEHPVDFFRIKFTTEEYLKASGLKFSIVRGPGFMETQHDITGGMILKKRKAFLFGRGEGRSNYVSVKDMARFLVWSLKDERLRDRRVNVADSEVFTQNELIDVYEMVCGFPVKRSFLPIPLLKTLKVLIGPFHPVARRIFTMGVLMGTSDSSFDPGDLLEEFSWQSRSYEESARDWWNSVEGQAGK